MAVITGNCPACSTDPVTAKLVLAEPLTWLMEAEKLLVAVELAAIRAKIVVEATTPAVGVKSMALVENPDALFVLTSTNEELWVMAMLVEPKFVPLTV